MKLQRYFVISPAAFAALQPIQGQPAAPQPAGWHFIRCHDAVGAIIAYVGFSHDQGFGRGQGGTLPQGWLELPHLLMGGALPPLLVTALANDFGVLATDTPMQVVTKLHQADPSGVWLP